jgi:hypothetical protein
MAYTPGNIGKILGARSVLDQALKDSPATAADLRTLNAEGAGGSIATTTKYKLQSGPDKYAALPTRHL